MMRWFRRIVYVLIALLALWAFFMWRETFRPVRPAVVAVLATTVPALALNVAPAVTAAPTFYPVVKVVDGDTIKVLRDGVTTTVRLIGADTPEVVDPRKPVQCFGSEASAEAKRLIAASGDEVRLESDPTQAAYDQYGRLLAYAYLQDGTLLEEHLINTGFAREYTFKGSVYEFQPQFRAAQVAARASKLGLWSRATCNGGR